MKILLINIDSTIPNLALKKIEKYHLDRGNEILWDLPIMRNAVDKIYVSSIFSWNKYKCREWEGIAEIGGSGYDLKKELPPEIEVIKPKINIGFTTRGCIRNCHFCIVPEKEGKIRPYADIYDIWDGKSKEIILLDNNILACPEHFDLIYSQLKKEKLRVDFNQGLDHRLLNDDNCKKLFKLKHKFDKIRFAFDDIAFKPSVKRALNILKRNGLKPWQTRWYIYVGIKDTFETVYERMMILHEQIQGVFVMRDKEIYDKPEYVSLAGWGSYIGKFKYPYKEYLKNKGLHPIEDEINGDQLELL